MKYQLFIALRYLKIRRKEAFVSLLTIISIIGVAVGVTALVIAQALTAGTHEAIVKKIVGNSADVLVYPVEGGGMSDYISAQRLIEAIDGVEATAPVVIQWGLVESMGSGYRPAYIFGVIPEEMNRISSILENAEIDRNVMKGEDWILLAKGLARNLHLSIGERIKLVTARGSMSPIGMLPVPRYFRFAGTFETGLWQTDDTWCYVNRNRAQKMFGMRNKVNLIQVKVRKLEEAKLIADMINTKYEFQFSAVDWTSMNKSFYSALKLEKLILFLTLGLIVAVAALNIVSLLVVQVVEKQKSIGVLRTLGADSRSIMVTFMFLGLMIGVLGVFFGVVCGIGLSSALDSFQIIKLDPSVYPIEYIRFKVKFLDVVWVVILTLMISFLSALYPARRAASLNPAESLRNE